MMSKSQRLDRIVGISLVILGVVTILVFMGFRVGIEAQEIGCLPYTTTLVHLEKPSNFHRGDLIALVTHGEMGGNFDGKLLGKMIVAVPGDRVAITHDQLYVNGIKLLRPLDLLSQLFKDPGDYDRQFVVPPDHLFVIGTESRSYDSRYWGPVPTSEVVGHLYPLLPISSPSAHELAQQTLGARLL